MGLLFKPDFWAGRLNAIHDHRPAPNSPMSADTVQQILLIACKALNDLVEDSQFEKDIKIAYEIAKNQNSKTLREGMPFQNFVEQFVKGEREVLWNSGTNIDAANSLLVELLSVSASFENIEENFKGLSDKIRKCRDLACEGQKATKKRNRRSKEKRDADK